MQRYFERSLWIGDTVRANPLQGQIITASNDLRYTPNELVQRQKSFLKTLTCTFLKNLFIRENSEIIVYERAFAYCMHLVSAWRLSRNAIPPQGKDPIRVF